jgi:hypothetical protein
MNWKWWHYVAVIALVVAGVLIGWRAEPDLRVASWFGLLGCMLLLFFVVGLGVTGRPLGILIDERKKMSLSRLQLVLWTAIVLAAYSNAVGYNVQSGEDFGDAINVAIPEELWVLMGISTTSLVGSPLLRQTKAQGDKQPDPQQLKKTLTDLNMLTEPMQTLLNSSTNGNPTVEDIVGATDNKVAVVGTIVQNTEVNSAAFSDIFMGEESGNASIVDFGKLQMFFFTIVVVLTYALVLGDAFEALGASSVPSDNIGAAGLPLLPEGIVALLGISHAGYLTNKGISHSKTEPS